jgi:Domain of unknown function (DUF4932)
MIRWSGSCVAVLVIASSPAAGQAGPPPPEPSRITIGVDRRIELFVILFKLAGASEFNANRFKEYNADIERHFGPFRNHEAVALARGLHDRHRVFFASVIAIPIRLSDPPALRERVPFDSTGRWPGPPDTVRLFVEAARRFAVASQADSFFAAHRTLYDSVNARLRRPMERLADLPWLARFFGVPTDRDFVVVPMLANSGTNFASCMQPPDTRLACYSILGHEKTDSAGFPLYDDGFVGTLIHEAGHGFVNPLGDARRAEFERSAPRVHALVADAMTAQAYGHWTIMLNESLLHAMEARYAFAHQGPSAMPLFFAGQRQQSWFWVEELSNLYAEFETSRQTYPTFESFVPRVIAYWDSLPERVPAMIKRYDAQRPKVVSLSIENGSQTVDPDLQEITVRFDRPVRENGWSLGPIFGPSGSTPEARARVPRISWKSWGSVRTPYTRGVGLDSTGTTFHIGVELEPGREYELQLNTPHGYGFRNADDGVPLAPYRIRFKTRPS